MNARKIGLLFLLLAAGGAIEAAFSVRNNLALGPEGCRVMGGRFYGPSYTFEQTESREVAAATQLEVRNSFGGVRVSAGAPGLVKVRLRKVVYLATEEKARAFAQRIELRLTIDGASARVGTNRDELGRNDHVGFETHLEIEAGPDSAVFVRNEHGRVDLVGVQSADVVSSFDGVSVERLAGRLKLESRHGDVAVSDIAGPLELVSRHGNVVASGLSGVATIDSQHGDVSVRRSGALEIRQQHGAVSAEAVDGELLVKAEHAEVKADDVRASAEVSTSFGAIRLARVGGAAQVKAEHGEIEAQDVSGGVTARTTHARISLARVGGPVELTVDHGGIEAAGLLQGAHVRAQGGDVKLDGVSGPIEIELQRGNAQIAPRAAISAPVTASVQNGDARLELPQGSRVTIESESRRGEVHADVPELAVTSERKGNGRGSRLSGRVAGGGSAVTLNADGDVTIENRSPSAVLEGAIARPDLARAAERPAAEENDAEAKHDVTRSSPKPGAAPSAASSPTPRPKAERSVSSAEQAP